MDSKDVSQVLGWGYFICWSLSFYPQFILNCKSRATHGLSADFQWLNWLGFSCYAVFNSMMYWNNRVIVDNEARGGDGLVQFNDVCFSLHALLLTSLTLGQIYWFQSSSIKPTTPLSFWVRTGILCTLVFLLVTLRITLQRNYHWDVRASFLSHNLWTWLGWCLLLSFVKLGITLIKYFPQAYLNFKRKSTLGWSIGNVLLDFSGGVLSLLQLFVDAYFIQGDLNSAWDNPVKLCLGLFSIGFDVVFMVQHYCLYTESYRPILEENLMHGTTTM